MFISYKTNKKLTSNNKIVLRPILVSLIMNTVIHYRNAYTGISIFVDGYFSKTVI